MEIAYLHLVTNHIPVVGVPFAIALLLLGMWRKSDELKMASLIAFVVIGLSTVGVYFLGQGGEDFVEDLAGVTHDSIEDHEEAATFALVSVIILAVVSAFALVRSRLSGHARIEEDTASAEVPTAFPRWILLVVLVLSVASAGIVGYTARLGGKIRHPEFHGGAQTNEEDADSPRDEGESDEKGRGRGRNRGRE